ncbi:hypothetical protein [Pseudokineococcus marinus]|uniref:Uncharacterized protein n=1 Tax=Pseudokineococcus marinus TaxID=351215 RepID=A0A849BNQ6_9ACTN|nr:hypothetical protein [Pseudokineococcus marinus]NNH22452.1 hypothetical protein [Pseudokineococcus marinus]
MEDTVAAPGSTPPRRSPGGPDGQGGPGEPGGRHDAPERGPAADAVRRSLLFSLLLLGALLAERLPFPWSGTGLLFTAGALVAGGLALADAVRARRSGTLVVLAAGLVLALFVLVAQVVALVVWPLQDGLRDCLAGAVGSARLTRSAGRGAPAPRTAGRRER